MGFEGRTDQERVLPERAGTSPPPRSPPPSSTNTCVRARATLPFEWCGQQRVPCSTDSCNVTCLLKEREGEGARRLRNRRKQSTLAGSAGPRSGREAEACRRAETAPPFRSRATCTKKPYPLSSPHDMSPAARLARCLDRLLPSCDRDRPSMNSSFGKLALRFFLRIGGFV